MAELLRFDPDAMCVRSVGDTPGVVVALRAGSEFGVESPVLLIDPGGRNRYRMFHALWLVQHCEDAVAHFAVCGAVEIAFTHEAAALISGQHYGLLGRRTFAHEKFQQMAAAWAQTAYTFEELEEAAAFLLPRYEEGDTPCVCPECRTTVEFDALEGVTIPDDASALMSGPLAVQPDPEVRARIQSDPAPEPDRKPWWKR